MLSTKIRGKSIGKMSSMRLLASILITAVAVFLTAGEFALVEAEELEEAKVFIEWNTTDGDQGIQFFWDSEGFTAMTVSNEQTGELFVDTLGNVLDQGLTEVAIESVEPEDSEQTLYEFFTRFPVGTYNFNGTATDGGSITDSAEFTHDLLEPVEFTKIYLPVIEWTEPEVKMIVVEGEDPYPGNPDEIDDLLEVVGYERVVELVIEDEDEEERVFKETTTYPAGINKHVVGKSFMKLIKNPPGEIIELKVEILADEPSGNRTITEEAVFEED